MRRPLPGTAVLTLTAGLTAALLAAPAALAASDPLDRTPVKGPSGKGVALTALGSYASDVFDASAAEIVAHDPLTQRLFVVNAAPGTVDVLDGRDPARMTRLRTLGTAGLRAANGSVIGTGAVVNSVAVRDGLLAIAVQAPDKVQPGWTVFFGTEGDLPFVSAVRVGQTFLVTADEGDAREWGDDADVTRLGSAAYRLCADALPDAASLKQAANLGRLNVSVEDGRRPGADCFETVHVLGSRSLSVFTTEGERVFDSGGEIERLIAGGACGVPASDFNSNHTSNTPFDARSDDKGPEPEGVTVGRVAGRTYGFLGLERTGGVLTYDVTDPRAVTFVDDVNNRGWLAPVPSRAAGDLGTEGVTFVPADRSPTGGPLLLTANEVSGTTTAFAVGRRR